MSSEVYKPSDTDEKISRVYDMMSNRIKEELSKLLEKVLTSLEEQDNNATQTMYTVNRIDRMYERMKVDVGRHETLCFELATKFDQQFDVICQQTNSIEALKSYAIITDVHLEAYLPFQVAGIAYEVGKGLVQAGKKEKYRKHGYNVFKAMEKNCLNVIDPTSEDSKYRKI